MKLYRYVMTYDTGLAPNPYHGYCTLALCKPQIRRTAQVGDWIMGLGSKRRGYECRLVFAMRVAEALTLEEYWQDRRFEDKKPRESERYEDTCGDNVYQPHESASGWIQLPCFHCDDDVATDTRTNRVLIADIFVYFGSSAIELPVEFMAQGEKYFCGFRNHQVHNLPTRLQHDVIEWLESLRQQGGRRGYPAQQEKITGATEEVILC